MPQTYTEQAVVLQRRPFRSYDYRVSLYTKEHGKIDAIARGALRPQSRLAAHLEPLTLVDVMVITGQVLYVGGAVSRNCFSHCKADFEKIMTSGQAVGQVNRWLKEHISDEQIFVLTTDFLDILNHRTAQLEWYQWLGQVYLFKILDTLGYRLNVTHCQNCAAVLTAEATLNCRAQGLLCRQCHTKVSDKLVSVRSQRHLTVCQTLSLRELADHKAYRAEIMEVQNLLAQWSAYMNQELTHERLTS